MNKLFIAGFLFFSAHPSFSEACPNLSGNYQFVHPTINMMLNIKQLACQSAQFTYTYADSNQILGKLYPLDHVRRKTFEDNDMIVYETASLDEQGLNNIVEDFYKSTGKTITAVTHVQLDADGNLSTEDRYFDSNGVLYHTDTPHFIRK